MGTILSKLQKSQDILTYTGGVQPAGTIIIDSPYSLLIYHRMSHSMPWLDPSFANIPFHGYPDDANTISKLRTSPQNRHTPLLPLPQDDPSHHTREASPALAPHPMPGIAAQISTIQHSRAKRSKTHICRSCYKVFDRPSALRKVSLSDITTYNSSQGIAAYGRTHRRKT